MRTTAIFKSILLNLLIAAGGINFATASTNASGLTSQYSCVMNRQIEAFTSNLIGGNGIGISLIFYLDYSKNTGSMNMTLVDKFGTTGALGSQKSSDFVFTDIKYSGVPNTYLLTGKLSDGSTTDIYYMPVNSGNTLIVSSVVVSASKAPWTGVCQKI